jgi:hypothetical protein
MPLELRTRPVIENRCGGRFVHSIVVAVSVARRLL